MTDNKQWKVLLYVTLGIALLQLFFDVISIITIYLFQPNNPLIPKHLVDYASFPLFILIAIHTVIGLFSFYWIKTKIINKILILLLFSFSIVLVVFKSEIILLFQSFNPYG